MRTLAISARLVEAEAKRIAAAEAAAGLWKWSELKPAAQEELRHEARLKLERRQRRKG